MNYIKWPELHTRGGSIQSKIKRAQMGHDQAKTPNFPMIVGWNPVMARCPKFGQEWF